MKHLVTLVGARPQFIKAAVFSRALARAGLRETLVHTGQHYDNAMSRVFFDQLDLPRPHVNLNVGSGSHAEQTGEMMVRLERMLLDQDPKPDGVVVFGDTNSTLAGALVAAKIGLPLVHVEAGLRSFNRAMPEEVNRVITDRISDLCFCPSRSAEEQLKREGLTKGVYFTGDVMFDALRANRDRALETYPAGSLVPFAPGAYYLATVHRAENTDDPNRLATVLAIFAALDRPVVWPIHPRASRRLRAFNLTLPPNIHALDPVGYLAILSLLAGARRVLTDSGGLQKEAFWMERPCLTLRTETEWTETLIDGWNHVVGLDPTAVQAVLQAEPTKPPGTPYGPGDAADVMARLLEAYIPEA